MNIEENLHFLIYVGSMRSQEGYSRSRVRIPGLMSCRCPEPRWFVGDPTLLACDSISSFEGYCLVFHVAIVECLIIKSIYSLMGPISSLVRYITYGYRIPPNLPDVEARPEPMFLFRSESSIINDKS